MDGRRMAAMGMVLLGTGCGGVMTDPPTVDMSTAETAGAALASGLEAAARDLPVPMMIPAEGCATLSGDRADPDGDLIPADETITWKHCAVGESAYEGSVTVKDDDVYPAYAFSGTIDLATTTRSTGGTLTQARRTGTFRGSQGPATDGSIEYDFAYQLGSTLALEDPKSGSHQATESYRLTGQFLPQAGWAPGAFAGQSTWLVSGEWSIRVDGQEAQTILQSVKPLTVDQKCASAVTSGEILASYPAPEGHRTLAVLWTGCGHTITRLAMGAPPR